MAFRQQARLLTVGVLAASVGCASPARTHPRTTALTESARPSGEPAADGQGAIDEPSLTREAKRAQRELHRRAIARVPRAAYYKPCENLPPGPGATFAPLFVWAVDAAHDAQKQEKRFGALVPGEHETVLVDAAAPTVYYTLQRVEICGAEHDALLYAWWSTRVGREARHQALFGLGLRIILDAEGYPAVWEVVDREQVARVLYVSRSLEAIARELYEEVLPSRTYAVERSVADRPRTFVVRILDDGPVPMGPYIYLEPDGREITSVACRCMPSQVDAFVREESYDLKPLEEVAALGLDLRFLDLPDGNGPNPKAGSGGADQAALDLTGLLRWPHCAGP